MRRVHEVSDEQNRFAPRILIQSCSAMVITVQSPTLVKFLQSHQWILCLRCPWTLSGSQDIILEWPSHRSSQCPHKYFKKIGGIWRAFSWSDTTLGKWFKDESYQECSRVVRNTFGGKELRIWNASILGAIDLFRFQKHDSSWLIQVTGVPRSSCLTWSESE